MQDLLTELLWKNVEVNEAAARLCRSLPGFSEAEQEYDELAERIRSIAGPELYDQYFVQLMRRTGYEVQAYYSLGLGLRREIIQALDL